MDRSKFPSKTIMSFPTIKYNVNQDELEEIQYSATDLEGSFSLENSDTIDRSKKAERPGPSILDKYLKAFKADKLSAEEPKPNINKESSSDKKSNDIGEISGSPIKEYFNKFQKRSDSTDNSEAETNKDSKDTTERWNFFSDIKVKLSQAVEDIKSSRNNEEIKGKQNSIEDVSDSEENSLHQELDPSMASTENQVSSISSSTQNLSDLSLGLSHSSTITDNEMETHSSSESNLLNVTPTADKKDESVVPKSTKESSKFLDKAEFMDEIESGVDALEDLGLLANASPSGLDGVNVTPSSLNSKRKESFHSSLKETNDFVFFSYTFMFSSISVLIALYLMPTFIMTNGIFIGLWLSSFLHKLYLSVLNYFGYNKEISYDRPGRSDYRSLAISKVPQIVEFQPLKKYEGWVNIYSYKKYDPALYHVSLTTTVYMKLEGSRLRISYTYNKIPKRGMYDEKKHDAAFYEHKIIELDGAQIMLLPLGIVKKRHWSKKYPICMKITDRKKITVLSHIQMELDNVNNVDMTCKSKDSSLTESSKCNKMSDDANVEKSGTLRVNVDGKKAETPKKVKEKYLTPEMKSRKSKSRVRHFHMEDFVSDDSDDEDNFCRDPSLDNFQDVVNCDPTIGRSVIQFNDDNIINVFSNEAYINNKNEPTETESINLYLFCRTGREKAEWFRRLKCAIDEVNSQKQVPESVSNIFPDDKSEHPDITVADSGDTETIESKARLGSLKGDKKAQDGSDTSVLWTPGGNQASESLLSESFVPVQDVDFWKHMKSIIEKKYFPTGDCEKSDIENYLWLNALLGRVAFDTFRNPVWAMSLQERIQKKLSSIKLPPFMGPLIVSNLELGYEAPLIIDAAAPTLDACGIWVDLQLSYSGRATMTLTTQLNLMSLKERKDTVSSEESQEDQKSPKKFSHYNNKKINLAVFDSDLEDTAESSSDDEAYNISSSQIMPVENQDSPQLNVGNTPAKKLLRIVDKIAANKYFQHVTEYKYVKRAMEGVSKTDLKLNVELCELVGCFTINIPPPPSDRLWFGFRGSPHLVIKAKPILGSRVINFAHVTGWIEKRLIREFEKILVYPNLEDIILDSMIPPPL